MIKSIQLLYADTSKSLSFTHVHEHKIIIDDFAVQEASFTLKVEFNCNITFFRNHDYKWKEINHGGFSNWYSPKILKLDSGQLIQANQQVGIWEYQKKQTSVLLWHFNPYNSGPIVNYDADNTKHIVQSNSDNVLTSLGFLLPKESALEVSRSKIPFSAIACFTDHCDFDTLENLKEQRVFFRTHDIKLTKGFFLYHYSKRQEIASWEHNADEFNAWVNDNHELAYHSLSQSIKPIEDACEDVKNFEPPIEDIPTWIDHGFQPYNFTAYKNHDDIEPQYTRQMQEKGVRHFWNYLDSGTAAIGVINQVNPKHFTLGTYYNGIKHLGFKSVMSKLIKAICFHYYTDNQGLILYRKIAKYVKTSKKRVSFDRHFKFVFNLVKLIALLAPVFLFWNRNKKKTYPLAKYTPLFFNHSIDGMPFKVFQTIEMIDFKMALGKANIDMLIAESGVFIAHTYFSAPMNYHQGKLFQDGISIDKEVSACFKYISEMIASKRLWNPTFNELVNYMGKLENVRFDSDADGTITIENEDDFIFRAVR
ncbi:hypothetical protein [Psychroserpens algicola]|uniref:hypothetical protein n=1 Tax=Psychroserpens algicola TaxID=1719034 RepID=UPI001954107A|nr:hypothetical protein [Psychroserpens algicola]